MGLFYEWILPIRYSFRTYFEYGQSQQYFKSTYLPKTKYFIDNLEKVLGKVLRYSQSKQGDKFIRKTIVYQNQIIPT